MKNHNTESDQREYIQKGQEGQISSRQGATKEIVDTGGHPWIVWGPRQPEGDRRPHVRGQTKLPRRNLSGPCGIEEIEPWEKT